MSDYASSEMNRDLDLLGAEAVVALRKFLSNPDTSSVEVGRARVAASALSAWTRNKATESAREGNFLLLARELATNKEEFRKFVQLGMPTAPIVKALPKKSA